MFGNYLTTALNNLSRNKLYAAITVLGLAVAFTVAILVGQFVRNEFTYDHWIKGHERVYWVRGSLEIPGQKPQSVGPPNGLVGQMKTQFPGVAKLAQLFHYTDRMRRRAGGVGDDGGREMLGATVDPDFFEVLPLSALAGDLTTALQQPDTVVLTRRMARKYFGRDDPIGQTIEVHDPDPSAGFHAVRVTAVLRDFPVNTTLSSEIFISGRSAWTPQATIEAHPEFSHAEPGVEGYARLSTGVSFADLQRALDVAVRPDLASAQRDNIRISLQVTPLDEVHWLPGPANSVLEGKTPGDKTIISAIAAIATLMVLVAAINFVTLMTARAARRGVEVGVRKATGATRSDLIIQFMGEALIQVAISVLIAAAMAEVLIKPFDALAQKDLSIDFVRDPALLAYVTGFALVVGALAATYPALVLSSFRPRAVLKGGTIRAEGSPLARATLVAIQFAVLVGLIFMTTTIYRQTRFALDQGIGSADSNLIVQAPFHPCKGPFLDEVRKLPGVSAAVCAAGWGVMMPHGGGGTTVNLGKGRRMDAWLGPTDIGFFEFYGIHPLAGRLFSRAHGEDGILASDPYGTVQPSVVINQTAARAMGYANPQAAIGKPLTWTRLVGYRPAQSPGTSVIIGVVPDMPVTVSAVVEPEVYYVDPQYFDMASIKLTGRDVLGTMNAIASTWKRIGAADFPFMGSFLSQIRLSRYAEMVIQGEALGICAGLSILIACLGLFGLAAFMAERRTKEIGIRKALGASTFDVVRLLLWQFMAPVICAVALALPVGFWVMRGWLNQFVYRVPLSLWTFGLAGVAAVTIAWLTVSYQSWVVAKAKPAGALQYE